MQPPFFDCQKIEESDWLLWTTPSLLLPPEFLHKGKSFHLYNTLQKWKSMCHQCYIQHTWILYMSTLAAKAAVNQQTNKAIFTLLRSRYGSVVKLRTIIFKSSLVTTQFLFFYVQQLYYTYLQYIFYLCKYILVKEKEKSNLRT